MQNINRFGTGDTSTVCLLQGRTLISASFKHYLSQTQVKADGLIS